MRLRALVNFLLYFLASLEYLFFFLFIRIRALISLRIYTVTISMMLIYSLAVLLSIICDSIIFAYAD